jgi:hypothetical protein
LTEVNPAFINLDICYSKTGETTRKKNKMKSAGYASLPKETEPAHEHPEPPIALQTITDQTELRNSKTGSSLFWN